MNQCKRHPMFVAVSTIIAALSQPVLAQNALSEQMDSIEEVVTVGTRSAKPRSVTESPVPVDVFSGDEFNSLGNSADVTDNLKTLVPSYTATPATGDASAFVRPTSLRGMAPDQMLVLINGKRRHRSSLVHFFAPAAGNGAHGPDVGMIPNIALKSVEVLRDGAAAQYGSDAIAGVLNFQMKDASEGGELVVQYGEFFEDEQSTKIAGNLGLPLGENGFINLSLEHNDNEALSRGNQRPDAQGLIDSGVTGVGADAPFGDDPLVQSWGRPDSHGTRFFYNAGYELSESLELYSFGNYADTFGRYRFFYRPPTHSSIQALGAGFTGLPAGYTPFLDGEQEDYSLVLGARGEFDNGLLYDFSVSYGRNELEYYLNNTINPDLGLVNGEIPQRNFDVGGYEQEEVNLNADFSLPLSDSVNLAFGAEWREETFTANTGEPNSYFGVGSNGFSGTRPEDSGEFDRDNYALYADIEHDISEELLLQYALRYEDFSDFGDTINGKIAGRYTLTDAVTLRAAVSTGFHAPTPGQSNIRATITTFDGTSGQQVEEGLIPATEPLARAAGGTELKEEESLSYSFGLTADVTENTTLTMDFYLIEVDDRIYRTGDIPIAGTSSSTISFYTNALDMESQGVDIVLTSNYDWSDDISTDISFAFNYNEVDITDQAKIAGNAPVSDAIVEDIENNYPNERFVLTANTFIGENWSYMVRANYYGAHYDERGTINDPVQPSKEIDSIVYIDMELNYDYNENLRVSLGAVNIFDEYVDKIGEPYANRNSVGLPYPRRSAANYEGGSWYLRTQYKF